jgi:NAD(P)-dependent dehydrogenase (short-subunit alcohol dehydrogenase family)
VFPSELSAPLFNPFRISKDKPITEEGAFSRSYQPAERAGSEEDMAGITLYMTSKAGSFLNGSVILVDGGKLATMPATY